MNPTVTTASVATLTALLIMLGEFFVSRAHERELRMMGAVEPPGDVHRTMTWAYPLAFVAPGIEGALFGPEPGASTLAGAVIFGLAKALKFWAIASLGRRWTFRVLVPPTLPLVTRGPYAWLRHPNYVAVIGELAGFAIFVGAPAAGVAAILGFGLLLRRRIAVEEQALGLGRVK
jgi:methyltransferase